MNILDSMKEQYGITDTKKPSIGEMTPHKSKEEVDTKEEADSGSMSILDSMKEQYGVSRVTPPQKDSIDFSRLEIPSDMGKSVLDNEKSKYGLDSIQQPTITKFEPPKPKVSNGYQYPEHLLKAEVGDKISVANRLHGAGNHTIGYGLDLKYDKNNYKYLEQAGVSKSVLDKLRKGDTSIRLDEAQVTRASNLAYQAKYKQIRSLVNRRMTTKFESMSPRMQDMMISLGYNGYLTPIKRKKQKQLNEFRGKVWDLASSNDEQGLLDYIESSNFRGGAVRNRFRRSGFLN